MNPRPSCTLLKNQVPPPDAGHELETQVLRRKEDIMTQDALSIKRLAKDRSKVHFLWDWGRQSLKRFC